MRLIFFIYQIIELINIFTFSCVFVANFLKKHDVLTLSIT